MTCLRDASNSPNPKRFTPGCRSDSVSARIGELDEIERASDLNFAAFTVGNWAAVGAGAEAAGVLVLGELEPPPPLPHAASTSASTASSPTPPRGRMNGMRRE